MADHDNVYDDEELVSTNPNKRNWRGILIALLVIILVLALIVTSVALLTPPEEGPRIKGGRLRMADVLQGQFTPLLFNGSWTSPQHICFQDYWGGISLLELTGSNHSIRNLMTNETFVRFSPAKFSLSPDFKYMLLAQNTKKLFQYSHLAQYIVYDLQSREVIPVSPNSDTEPHPYLLKVQWTPRGHGLIIIQDYDIYYKIGPLSNIAYRVTNTGIPGIVSNGFPNWLYEEEILHSTEAFWMSRNSHLLLYATFDDSEVEEMYSLWFGDDSKSKDPQVRALRYPKPDEKVTCVRLYVSDLADPRNIQTKPVKPPPTIGNVDHYLTTASWISPTEVCLTWMNRLQNISFVSICKNPSWKCQEVQKIIFNHQGWVDTPLDPPIFSTNGSSYITIAPMADGQKNYHKHIVRVHVLKRQVIPITYGEFEVMKILSWDDARDMIFFIGAPLKKSSQRHLYRVSSSIPGMGDPPSQASCITCDPTRNTNQSNLDARQFTPEGRELRDDGSHGRKEDEHNNVTSGNNEIHGMNRSSPMQKNCQYHNAIFSSSSEHFVLECLGPGVPNVLVYETLRHDIHLILTLQDNSVLREKLSKYALPQSKTFSVQTSGGYDAQVRLLLPPGLREDEITRYPLVVQIYGAPGTQLVTDVFKIDWSSYLASGKDVIVAQIDGRGTGAQGYRLMHEIYNRLGTAEVADQLEVTEYLRDSLQFINKERIAAWGWSYGGFITAHLLAQPEQDVIHCGISVAPIVSWEHHNSVYAERYMGSPNITSNYHGYMDADLRNRVKHLRGKMFYLIHGMADNNVPYQQSMIMARRLVDENISFRQQVYPDIDHFFSGAKDHLYLSMQEFFDSCFMNQMTMSYHMGLTDEEFMLNPV